MRKLLFSILVLTAQLAGQTTWYVDATNAPPGSGSKADPFVSITQGLNNAGPGDTIYVAPGTYSPSLTGEVLPISIGTNGVVAGSPVVDHTNLKLIASEGPFNTVIDAEGATTQLLRFFGTSSGATVRGFRMRGAGGSYMIRNGSTSVGFEGAGGTVLDGCILEADPGGLNNYAYAILIAQPGNAIINCWFVGPFASDTLWLSNDFAPAPGGGVCANNVIVGGSNNGIRIQGGNWTVVNNVIASNASRGILDFAPVTPPVINYVIDHNCWFNNGADIDDGGTGGTGAALGANAVFGDPLFVDPVNGDYHLIPGSPCTDAGTTALDTDLVAQDIDDDPRFIATLGAAAIPDIGGDELTDVRLTITIPPSLSIGVVGLETTGPATDLEWRVFSFQRDPQFVPGVGNLFLSLAPGNLFFLDPLPVPLGAGVSVATLPIAGLPVGVTAWCQSIVLGAKTRFTNPVRITICP